MSPVLAIAKRSSETALMPPPPPPKKIKRPTTALEEEEYEHAISRIIKRDFFPGLAESDSQKEYLAALESDDPEWIAEAGRHLTAVTTPGPDGRRARNAAADDSTPVNGPYVAAASTPKGWKGETPGRDATGKVDHEVEAQKGVDTSMSLSSFQSRYTSEDNESFYKLVDNSNKRRGKEYAWLWADNKIPTARQLEWKEREQKQIAQKAHETALNGGQELVSVEWVDKRKAAPDAWKAMPNNTFMFAPESIEDSMETVQQRAEANSKMGPKEIVYENTRMPPPPRPADVIPPSPSLSAVRDAIAGRRRLSGSELGSSVAGGGGGGETPRVNGYAFVDSEEPEPEPEQYASSSSSRLDLGPGDATPNPFKLREAGSRESLHHRMVDKLNVKKADDLKEMSKTPGRGGLTPAAQRLLGRATGATPRGGNSLGEAWGKTPKSKPSLAGVTPLRKG